MEHRNNCSIPNGQKDKEFYMKAVERIQFYIFDVLENSIFVR